jgi:hypothetical protein
MGLNFLLFGIDATASADLQLSLNLNICLHWLLITTCSSWQLHHSNMQISTDISGQGFADLYQTWSLAILTTSVLLYMVGTYLTRDASQCTFGFCEALQLQAHSFG